MHTGARGYQVLEDDRQARLRLDELPDPAVDIDVALAHVHPPDGDALRHFPDRTVADVASFGVRDQRLERHVRILEHPDGIARVEADAHDVAPDRIDHHLHFARLEIAAMILDRELDPRIDDARTKALDRLHHVVDVHVDLRPLGVAAEDAAHAAGAEDLRCLERAA